MLIPVVNDDDDLGQKSEHPGPGACLLVSPRGPGDHGGDVPAGHRHHRQCQHS